MKISKTIPVPEKPNFRWWDILEDSRTDNRITVVYNGFGGCYWSSIDKKVLNNEEELMKALYDIQNEAIIKNKKVREK